MDRSIKRKLKAVSLRRQGKSLSFIAQKLTISKSTASLWCRSVTLNKSQLVKIKEQQILLSASGRKLGTMANKNKKQLSISNGELSAKKLIGNFTNRDLLIAGSALYWGEGSKSHKWKMVFSNSDPLAIRLMIIWFTEVFKVSRGDIMPRIFINSLHKDRTKEIIRFWSTQLTLPVSQFGKPIFLKSGYKKVYENRNKYYGVLALGVKNSSRVKYQVLGLVKALRQEAEVAQPVRAGVS